MLQVNTVLNQLNVYGNHLQASGGEAIARALRHNLSLRTLDLGDNQIGDLATTRIANALRKTTTLTSLQIQPLNDLHPGPSGMGDPRVASGCVALIQGLKGNSNIHTLNVGANSILSEWDPVQERFPHKMITPALWKGRQTVPKSVLDVQALPCTRTKLLLRPKDLRHSLLPPADEEEGPGKPSLAFDFALKRKKTFKVHKGSTFEEISNLHQMSLMNLTLKGPRLMTFNPDFL